MKEFYEAVKDMRKIQKEYFRSRSQEALRKSKEAESKVDKLIKSIEEKRNPQQRLF